jgi:hypothetical protein
MERWCWIPACLLLAGCVLGRGERALAPVPTVVLREPLEIHADFPLDEQHPLIAELAELRLRVAEATALPPAEQTVQVRVFSSPERLHAYRVERFPGFPARRAFFVKQHGRLEVCASWGERAAEDLRHETTHAWLHASVGELPLWLDEGLAEYFESPAAADGWHAEHAKLLTKELRRGWRPNLRRLESISASGEMTQLDYAESWAWTWLLLNTAPPRRELLQRHLHALRDGPAAPPLSALLLQFEPRAEETLMATLTAATSQPPAGRR